MKKAIFLLIVLIGIVACQQGPSKEEKHYNKVLQEVFDVHDEVMGKMSKMGQQINELEAKVDTTQEGEIYKAAAEDLKNAHKAMMGWMHVFAREFPDVQADKKYTKDEYEAQAKKLEEEKKKMEAIAEKTKKGMQKADFLLTKEE